MKAIWSAILVAVLAVGCAAANSPPTLATGAGVNPYQANQGALGLRAEDDLAYSAGNPFRLAAFALYPVGLILQRAFEGPYVAAAAMKPEWWGLNESEQEYLEQRWHYRYWVQEALRPADAPPPAR
jgi:hypothetical protein